MRTLSISPTSLTRWTHLGPMNPSTYDVGLVADYRAWSLPGLVPGCRLSIVVRLGFGFLSTWRASEWIFGQFFLRHFIRGSSMVQDMVDDMLDDWTSPTAVSEISSLPRPIVVGHVVVGVGCLFGGVWHIATAPWSWSKTWSKARSKVRPKSGPKRVQNPPRGRKSPVKQANSKKNGAEKGVKNGPQKRHQKSRAEIGQKPEGCQRLP